MTEQKLKVLYADDEDDVRDVFAAVFGPDFDVKTVPSGKDALAALDAGEFDVLVSDMRMEPMKGSELLARAFEAHPDVQRILLTGYSDHGDLAEAVNRGHVFAYAQKPWDGEQLKLTIEKAGALRRLELENRRLLSELRVANAELQQDVEVATRTAAPKPKLMVTSPAMAKVLEQVVAVAATDANVLLVGETGVGKELVAQAIHDRSPRKKGRFVAQNLAALPPELMTSELFGHVKGAFTGASGSRRGLFELADGGTLFLDEIGEAPPSLQAMLLRALESREIWPVGGSEPRRIDLRVIAATNRDLLATARQSPARSADGSGFRLDLYYRLAVAPIAVPPLRDRPEDVRGLGQPMLEGASRRMGRALPRVTDAAWRRLEQHAWPGNVRELSNLMERLAIYHAGREVDDDDLDLPPSLGDETIERMETRGAEPRAAQSGANPVVSAASPGNIVLDVPDAGTTFDNLEKSILAQMLARHGGNQSAAARALGLSESTLRSRLKRLGLKS